MNKSIRLSKNLAAITLLSLLTACGSYAQMSSPVQKAEETLTDANIAAVVVGANQIDISAAEIALERSENPEIREFATRMIEDHNGVLGAAVDLVTRLGVTPVNNELVGTLGQQAAEHEANLMQLSGAEFDKAYIDHEVAYHQAVIDVINNTLIPGAQNEELKSTLISVVPAFNAHLEHSKTIAGKI